MTKLIKASRPTTESNKCYHTHTCPGDVSPLCLIPGAPGRASKIAKKFLENVKKFTNNNRGLVTYTGYYKGIRVSVTTSGMGGASLGIIVPEAVLSGARLFIRVGSCGSLIKESEVGQSIIVDSAMRRDGASDNWAPKSYAAIADQQVVKALVKSAHKNAPNDYHVGKECTTSCFYEGQGRKNIFGQISSRMRKQHEWIMKYKKASCYSMEAASLFVWCRKNGIPAAAINAIFGNRHADEWGTKGEDQAAIIALDALVLLSKNKKALAMMEKVDAKLKA